MEGSRTLSETWEKEGVSTNATGADRDWNRGFVGCIVIEDRSSRFHLLERLFWRRIVVRGTFGMVWFGDLNVKDALESGFQR